MKKSLTIIAFVIGVVAGYFLSTIKPKSKGATSDFAIAGPFNSQTSISQEEAQMLVDTFKAHWMEDANQKMGGKGEKTRSSFIPLTELDSLVATLDAERKKNGVTDGVRIYFGRYPKFHPDGKTPYEMAYHNTIILVSTKTARILAKGAKDSIYIHLDYYGAGRDKKRIMHTYADDPQNRTELCPDDCQGATLVCTDPTDPTCTGSNN